MIVSVDLLKGAYYLNGDKLIAIIKFNLEKSEKSTKILYTCLQIWCQCYFDEDKIEYTGKQNGNSIFSEEEKGYCVYFSQPKYICKNYDLDEHQNNEFFYIENIPFESYPSYRGILCKYAYKLIVTTQFVNSTINFVRIPFKVMVLQGLTSEILHQNVTPLNPFLKKQAKAFNVENVKGLIENIISPRSINYNILSENIKVCKLSLSKSYFKLGEDINISLDFRDAVAICLEVLVSLKDYEEFTSNSKWTLHKNLQTKNNDGKLTHTGYCYLEKRYSVLNAQIFPITLSLPFTITPTFSTNILKHQWKLHFQFTISNQRNFKSMDIKSFNKVLDGDPIHDSANTIIDENGWETPNVSQFSSSLRAKELKNTTLISSSVNYPITKSVETLTWDLPIKIFPEDPSIISAQYSIGKITATI